MIDDSDAKNILSGLTVTSLLAEFPNSFLVFDPAGKILSSTAKFARFLEYQEEEMVGKSFLDFVHDEDKENTEQVFQNLASNPTITNIENRLLTKSGDEVWIMWLFIPLNGAKLVLGFDRDITIQKDISFEFLLQQQKYKSIFDNLPMGIAITDNKGKIIETNKTARHYFDIKDGEFLNRTLNIRKYTLIQPNGSKIYPRKSSLMKALRNKEVIRNMEIGLIKQDKIVWFDILATPIPIENFGLAVAFLDITQRRHAEEKIAYMAFFDQLTNLPNRNSLLDKLFPIFEESRRHNNLVAILAIDLDNFKIFNDSRGHDFGDKILKLVAYRIRESIRVYDIISRQGGDEFTVVLPDLSNERDAAIISESILDAMKHPFMIDKEKIFVNVSIGIALYPTDGKDANTLIKNADSALNLAKTQGKNGYVFFREEMQTVVAERLEIENRMRVAIIEQQFTLVYQPKIDLRTKKPVGVEALIRWKDPERGLISPDIFIPISEETGMILAIGEWVLQTSLQTLRKWKDAGVSGVTMAVNISSKQFKHEKLVTIISENLKRFQMDPEDLEIELTESSVMENADAAIRTMQSIRNLGAKIAIDDFGTGYSSLGYLRKLPLSSLKIDRSFVSEITSDRDSKTIINAVSNLAHNLGLTVVAEGAETEAQVRTLEESGVNQIQGFYFAKPMQAEDCLAYLKQTF